jgi:hypothetical protein
MKPKTGSIKKTKQGELNDCNPDYSGFFWSRFANTKRLFLPLPFFASSHIGANAAGIVLSIFHPAT